MFSIARWWLPLLILSGFLCALPFSTALGAQIYVSLDESKTKNSSASELVFTSITAALESAQDGDEILLEAGVYDESNETFPLVIDKSVTLCAANDAQPVLNGPPFVAILRIEAPNVTVRGLNFQLRRWGAVVLADHVTLENNVFVLADTTYRVSSCGVWVAGAYSATLRENAFTGCGVCFAGPPLSERSKSMPVLTGLFEVGEDTALFTSHTVKNNTINGKPLYYYINQQDVVVPTDAGGLIAVGCNGIRVQNIDVSDSSMGLQIVHCSDVVVTDVTADRCGVFGVYLAYIKGGTLARVTCRNANHGIDLRDVKNFVVTDCVTDDCEQGIFLSWAFDSVVTQCKMRRCGNGLFFAVGVNNLVTNSLAEDCENGFYLQNEANVMLCNNEITGNTVAGIRFLHASGECVQNLIHDNWVGMLVADTQTTTLWNNQFTNNASAGLYLSQAAGVKLVSNRFDGESKAYIEYGDEVVDTLLVLNELAE